ncbi:MAG: hypothetical protein E7490_08635 [Ruminococcaceae bacterium]|nr:hypothetical protein [Oscillospiraceae bacterium]
MLPSILITGSPMQGATPKTKDSY